MCCIASCAHDAQRTTPRNDLLRPFREASRCCCCRRRSAPSVSVFEPVATNSPPAVETCTNNSLIRGEGGAAVHGWCEKAAAVRAAAGMRAYRHAEGHPPHRSAWWWAGRKGRSSRSPGPDRPCSTPPSQRSASGGCKWRKFQPTGRDVESNAGGKRKEEGKGREGKEKRREGREGKERQVKAAVGEQRATEREMNR